MAGLKFTIEADVQKLRQTRQEIEKLKKEMVSLPAKSPLFDSLQKRTSTIDERVRIVGRKDGEDSVCFQKRDES